jgi:hypothetical protein
MASFMGSSAAEQAAMIQEINSLEKLRGLHQSLRSEKARLIALTASLGTTNAATTAKINALSSSLQVTEKRYEDLYKAQKAISKESTGFETTMKSFQGLFGAGANSVTNSIRSYATALGDAAFQTREFTDITGQVHRETTMFGQSLGGNAAQVQKWTQSALLVASAAGMIADKVNDASIAQGKLSGLYGAKALSSAGEYYRLIGAGIQAGGDLGKATAEQMASIAMTGRRGYRDMMFTPGGSVDQRKLNSLTNIAVTGFPLPEYTSFAQNVMGEPEGKVVAGQARKISAEARYANIPANMYGKMIMDLANQFVSLGMTLDEAHEAVRGFADAVSKGTMSPAMAATMLNTAGQQQLTGAGVTMTLQNAAWVQQNFDKLPADLKKKLAGIQGVDVMTAGGMLSTLLDQSEYDRAIAFGWRGQAGKIGLGLNPMQAALFKRYVSPQATGMEEKQIDAIIKGETAKPYEGYDEEQSLRRARTGLVMKRDRATGKTRVITQEQDMEEAFDRQARGAAESQKRWYSWFQTEWNSFWGAFTDVYGTGERRPRVSVHPEDLAENVVQNALFPSNDTMQIPTSAGTVNIKVSVDDKNAVATKPGVQPKK